jgi:WD40 repeat protein
MTTINEFIFKRQLTTTKLRKVLIPKKKIKQHKADAPVYSVKFWNDSIVLTTKNHEIIVLDQEFKAQKVLHALYGRWTITDFHIKDSMIVHSSLCGKIHLHNLETEELVLFDVGEGYCVWSVKMFENKILAGCNDGVILLHDMERKKNILELDGHSEDVNSVAFVDGNVMVSGSDDSLIKVWDIRTMGKCGYLIGHTEGEGIVLNRHHSH